MTTTRRLAAIMVADVVGYSRMMEQDEAGTLAVLKQRRKEVLEPILKVHGGRIVKVMGDGVLVEFASAVKAVEGAIEIQKRMAAANENLDDAHRIVLRIGINLGDVIGEGNDIYGEGVNIAARLEPLAEPGGICISGNVRDEVKGKIANSLEYLGEKPLKNISTPVRAYLVEIAKSVGSPTQLRPGKINKPAIAVLPFVNMSGDTENEYFADGLTEDIITALSRSVTLSVIARTSSFAYKGKAADVKQIATELNVGYILEGSVRRAANHVRVTAQLIEAGTGSHIWAERFDGNADDIFEIQDQITRSVASATHTTIYSSAAATARTLEHFTSPAYHLAVQANSCLFEMTPDSFAKAGQLADEALALEPTLSFAHRLKANVFIARLATGLVPHTPANMERAVAGAREALRLAPNDEWCHWLMAFALAEAGRLEEAVAECDIGLEINPNASMMLGDKGDYLVMLGQPDEAIPLCELAIRLNPRDPICYWWENSIATAYFILGRFEAARDLARRVTLRKRDHIRATIIWAAAAGKLGRNDEAREAVRLCLEMFPDMRVSTVMPHFIPRFRRVEDCALLTDGLRVAGLPE